MHMTTKGKKMQDKLWNCVGLVKSMASISIGLQGRIYGINTCYGSDFLAQKSRLATTSSLHSSSYAYKI